MQRVLRHIYLLTILVFLCKPVFCQPFDLVYPQGEETDNVTKELKKLQNIQRDLALEKLTREPSKLDAYIELAELRLSQGRLHEAKRFFEMALKLSPNNLQANHGLVMVHYHLGDFDKSRERLETIHRYHPLSDYEREKLEEYKAKLNTSGTAGMYIREDSRGFQEVMSSIEASFPSETYKKLEVKYRAEMWSHEDSTEQINSNVYSATINYTADSNNILALTYSPETIRNGKSTNGFSLQGLAGNENMKLALRASKNIFKENIFTIKNQYEEDSQAITLYGNIHHRTKIVQGVTLTDISDNNSRRRYDTSVIYSLHKNHLPFLTASLSFWQSSYEKQLDKKGNLLNYWAPSDFKGNEFSLTWEKNEGVNWWWGLEANYIVNRYKFGVPEIMEDKGPGASLFCNYRFTNGNVFMSLSERSRNYFTERRLEIYASLNF